MRSLEVGSSTSGTASLFVRGDLCFHSCSVIASDPYIKRKGVNPVARHSIVFSAHTASGNWSAHFPFIVKEPFLDGAEDLAIVAFDDTVGLWVVHRGEDRLGADGTAEFPEVLAIKLFVVVDGEFGRDSEAADNVLPEEFLGGLRCYRGDCSGLNPLCEIFNDDKGELEVPLSCRQWPNDVQPPPLKWPCVCDELGEL
jgi:hypothetical protein